MALRLPPLPTIRDLIKLYKLRALKQLSQNFLLDQRITDKIVKASGRIEDSLICEIGPGPGSITRSILKRNPKKLIVIEKDKRFLPLLQHLSESVNNSINIITGDVMNFNLEKLIDEEFRKDWEDRPPYVHLIGNLPFNIATPLIIKWIKCISERSNAWTNGRVKMTLTFQKEVAERIVAQPFGKQRCRMSVMCQNWCDVNHKFNIPGRAFLPKPKVDVGVVRFIPWKNPQIDLPFELIEKVVRNIFAFRQKYSIRGAETLFPPKIRESLGQEMYNLADLNPKIRPFQLSNEEYGRLCYAYKTICDQNPKLYKYNHRASKGGVEFDYDDELIEEGEEEEEEEEEENQDELNQIRLLKSNL